MFLLNIYFFKIELYFSFSRWTEPADIASNE